jgi:hypothetical protein
MSKLGKEIEKLTKEYSEKITKLIKSDKKEFKPWVPEDGERYLTLYASGDIELFTFYMDRSKLALYDAYVQPNTSQGRKKLEDLKRVSECKYKLRNAVDTINAKINDGEYWDAKNADTWLHWDPEQNDWYRSDEVMTEYPSIEPCDDLNWFELDKLITKEEIKIALTGRVD